MSDIKLFRTTGTIEELHGESVAVEKSLQTLCESNLEALLGIRFLASEYSTGAVHGGRIDTLGLDENNNPVILEYKRATNENVINQGLYYLDWLLDHRGEFQLLVQKELGKDASETIDWSSPRLLCIAGGFTKFDEHAIQQIDRQIELIRYKRYGGELLLLELINVTQSKNVSSTLPSSKSSKTAQGSTSQPDTYADTLGKVDSKLLDVYLAFRDYMLALGDDVQIKQLKFYEAYKRIKNIASLVIQPQKKDILVYIYQAPEMNWSALNHVSTVDKLNHWGTGDLEIKLKTMDDFEAVKPLLQSAYERS